MCLVCCACSFIFRSHVWVWELTPPSSVLQDWAMSTPKTGMCVTSRHNYRLLLLYSFQEFLSWATNLSLLVENHVNHVSLFVWSDDYREKSFIPLTSGPNVINLITALIYTYSSKAWVFVPGKPFKPSLMFASNDTAYQGEAPFLSSSLLWGPSLAHKHLTRLTSSWGQILAFH